MFKISMLAWYITNKAYVVEEYCINKDQPEMHCDGKCYLANQIEKIEKPEKTKQSHPIPRTIKTEILPFLVAFWQMYFFPDVDYREVSLCFVSRLYKLEMHFDIFHPPQQLI